MSSRNWQKEETSCNSYIVDSTNVNPDHNPKKGNSLPAQRLS